METTDRIEELIDQWRRLRPDLDATPMRTSGRVLRLARLLERRVGEVLRPLGLSLWQFDVLATLRRTDRDLSPGELLGATLLTSGAMTHRIDRLEADGLVERQPDATDRRSVRVRLTPAGRRLVDRAIEARLEEASRLEKAFEPGESETLARLLAKLEASALDASGMRTKGSGGGAGRRRHR